MKGKFRYPMLAAAVAAALASSGASARSTAAAPAAPPAAKARAGAAAQLSEAQKIQRLISSVEHLKGAVFIRNGSEYDAAKAAAHLRRKLGYAGKRVRTADQFIEHLATGSSMTGKPYRIRFADGQSVDSAAYFREQLRKLESPPPSKG